MHTLRERSDGHQPDGMHSKTLIVLDGCNYNVANNLLKFYALINLIVMANWPATRTSSF